MPAFAATGERQFLTETDAARRLGVSIDVIQGAVKSGRLSTVQIHKRRLIPAGEVAAILAANGRAVGHGGADRGSDPVGT